MNEIVIKYIIGQEPIEETIKVPAPAIFLSCAVQDNAVVAWFHGMPDAGYFERRIALTETGQEVPDGQREYCGVMLLHEGRYVLHAWRLLD